MKKQCIICKKPKGFRSFHPGRNDCISCRHRYNKVWREKNREKLRKRAIAYRQERKLIVLTHYSNGARPYCRCCMITILEFLTLDHIKGRGNEDRRQFGEGATFYQSIIRRNFPKGFQVLCGNCQMGKLFNKGYCPHNPKVDLRLNEPKQS